MWLVSDTFRGATGCAPPSGCLAYLPSPGTASARARRSVRRVRLGYWWAPPPAGSEIPTGSRFPAARGAQTALHRSADRDTVQSTRTGVHTRLATPHLWAGPSPYDTDVGAPRAPRSRTPPTREWRGPPSPAPCE